MSRTYLKASLVPNNALLVYTQDMDIMAQPTETTSRLPPNLYTVYVQYKKDTQSIVQWLIQYGTSNDKEAKALTLRDIKRLVDVVCNEGFPKSRAIKYHFEAAIAARQTITRFFKARGPADSLATSTHEFFTRSLVEMYNSLFPTPQSGDRDVVGKIQSISGRSRDLVNRFQSLELDASTEEGSLLRETLSSQPAPSSTGTTIAGQVGEGHCPQITGDSLGEALEFYKSIEDMKDSLEAVTQAWEQVGDGTMPRLLAVFVTNTAMAAVEPIQQQLLTTGDDRNPELLKEKLLQIQQIESLLHTERNAPVLPASHLVEGLLTCSTMLQQSKSEGKAPIIQGPTVENPTDFFGQQHREKYHTDPANLSRVLENIKDRSLDDTPMPDSSDLTLQLVSEIAGFLLDNKYTNQGLRHSFGLLLIHQSYSAFLSIATEARKMPNCRLEALRFAQEIILYITAVLDDTSILDRGSDSVAAHIDTYKNRLHAFIHEKVFNLYSQSPWICGAQMIEMLRIASYYGLRLLSHQHRVGAILHCYNVISQFTTFKPIDVLERFMTALETIFFPGGRPTSNFKNCAMLFCGGRLEFERNSTHKTGRHRVVIPDRRLAIDGSGMRLEANDDRFSLSKVSWMFDIMTNLDYHLNQAEWETVDQNARDILKACRPLPKDSAMVKSVMRYENYIDAPSHRLQRLMQMALFTDFSDHLPMAKINYFSLYVACTKIIGIVSDRSHPSEEGAMCQCFMEKLVVAADTYQRKDGKIPFGHRALVENLSEALTEVLGDSKLEDFLWQSV